MDLATWILVAVAALLLAIAFWRGRDLPLAGLRATGRTLWRSLPMLLLGMVIAGLAQVLIPRVLITLEFGAEAHRWFDYWLKSIDNGVMAEPPITYYTLGAPRKKAWQTRDRWPLLNQKETRFYLHDGKTGTVASVNDGLLKAAVPADPTAHDAYTVDYTTTSGGHSRWGAVLGASDYPSMRGNDEKALTHTTCPLETNVEVTGHPVVHLWLVTGAADLDVFVYLEEVDGKGRSKYITEGNLRASHRALGAAPYDNLGLPYHRHYESDLELIPDGEPFELVFDLLATSYVFQAGSRLRVTVAFADADNFGTPILGPAPEISLLRNTSYPTYVELPIA